MLIGYLIFTMFMAFILALWEIQIEGKDGWAAKTASWRIKKGWVLKFTGGRPLMGYHLAMTAFMLGIIHLPLFFTNWSWQMELLLLGFLVGMLLVEDFLWFVLNPHYGIKKFRKGEIWWHKTWWGPVPSFYWFMIAGAVLLIYFGRTAI